MAAKPREILPLIITHTHSPLSKWDVSSVRFMDGMFLGATSFNGDLSKWDVSSVNTMPAMFRWATSFDGDISKWDVSSVTNMDYMFWDATLFKRKLCGAGWVHSKARKTVMFAGSSGSIPETACTTTASPATAATSKKVPAQEGSVVVVEGPGVG